MTYQINKDSFVPKFVFWTWNVKATDFTHICPFFWLAIFTILFSPVIIVLKGFIKGFTYLIDKYIDMRSLKVQGFNAWAESYHRTIQNDTKQLEYFLDNFYKNEKSQLFKFFINYLFHYGGDIAKRAREIYYQQKRLKEQKDADNSFKRKEKINHVLRYVKPFTRFVLYVLAVAGIAILGHLLYIAVELLFKTPGKVIWEAVLNIIIVLGIIIAGGAVIIYGGKFIGERDIPSRVGVWISNIFKKFGKYTSLLFSKYCPPINWK